MVPAESRTLSNVMLVGTPKVECYIELGALRDGIDVVSSESENEEDPEGLSEDSE